MGTVSKEIADDIVAGKYEDDYPVKIIRYTNHFDGTYSYGVINMMDDPNKYRETPYVINPTLYWQHPINRCTHE